MAVTMAINATAAENLLAAAQYAADSECPINWFVTVDWTKSDGAGDAGDRFARLRECLRHWLMRRNIPLICLWTMEKGTAAEPHSHMLLHLPPYLLEDFTEMLPKWIGGNQTDGLVDVRAIYSRGVRKYIVKGIEAHNAQRFGIRPKPQGKITGKRCGTSQNIGPAARARWASIAEQPEQAA